MSARVTIMEGWVAVDFTHGLPHDANTTHAGYIGALLAQGRDVRLVVADGGYPSEVAGWSLRTFGRLLPTVPESEMLPLYATRLTATLDDDGHVSIEGFKDGPIGMDLNRLSSGPARSGMSR